MPTAGGIAVGIRFVVVSVVGRSRKVTTLYVTSFVAIVSKFMLYPSRLSAMITFYVASVVKVVLRRDFATANIAERVTAVV